MSTPLQHELLMFLEDISLDEMSEGFSVVEKQEAKEILSTFKGEAQVTLSLIEEHLGHEIRLLEVGAGLCLVSLFLKLKGYKVVALEPVAGGFSFFEKLKTRILSRHSNLGLHVLSITAQELSIHRQGEFDLIYSNNVIEHIIELPEAMMAMRNVLSPSGKMVHSCPNYAVPYEPHFGLPVLSFFPSLTSYLWKQRIAQGKDLWESLNFITYLRVKQIGSICDCDVSFKKSLTFEVFQRLKNDSEFRSRHSDTLAGKIFRLLEKTHTLKLTKYIPAWASTPMIFTMRPKG